MNANKRMYRLKRSVSTHCAKPSRDWLRQLRKEKGMTQEEVAQCTGISRTYYVQLETGSGCKSLSPKVAIKIGTVLGFDWTMFFEEDKEQLNSIS